MRPIDKASQACRKFCRDEQGKTWLELALVGLLMCVVFLLLLLAVARQG